MNDRGWLESMFSEASAYLMQVTGISPHQWQHVRGTEKGASNKERR